MSIPPNVGPNVALILRRLDVMSRDMGDGSVSGLR